VLFAVLLFPDASALASEFLVVTEQSVFAVVTHKGGFAGGLAHDHFIAASEYTAHLDFNDSDLLDTKFHVRFEAENLVVDSKLQRERWYPNLEAVGILDKPFGDLSDKDRAKIRETMLGRKQLDAASFPEISAQLVSIDVEAKDHGDVHFSHRVMLAFTVRGQTVEKPVWARYELVNGVLRVEAVGEFRFRDFGIKPYSAMLGAIKNKDLFHLYVNLMATSGND
jgi:hypothetical protein